MMLDEMNRGPGRWLADAERSGGPVISSRVRLARNLSGHRFPMSADAEEKAAIDFAVHAALQQWAEPPLAYIDLAAASALDRRFLVERHLISRELEEAEGSRSLSVSGDETIAIMVNEEDHLRLQSIQAGLQLEKAYETVSAVDDHLSGLVEFAYDSDFGYLTACPTNVGTGLRASAMLHLPALVMSRHLEKAFRAIAKLNLAVRGLYGEGTEAHGDFYQISNQITIGRPEEDILADLEAVIDQVVGYELSRREYLLQKERNMLEDRVWRSYAILANARIINSEEVMRHLSAVRLGVNMGLLKKPDMKALNELFIFSQPAHLQKSCGGELPADERDAKRASMIRARMG